MLTIYWVSYWIGGAIILSFAAHKLGRSWLEYLVLGLIISPALLLIALLLQLQIAKIQKKLKKPAVEQPAPAE